MTPEALNQTRKSLGWSLSELGELLGYEKYQINRFETGYSPMPKDMKKRLIKVIKCHISEYEKILQSL